MKFPLYYPAHFTIFLISCSTGSAEPKYVFCGFFFKVVFIKNISILYNIIDNTSDIWCQDIYWIDRDVKQFEFNILNTII